MSGQTQTDSDVVDQLNAMAKEIDTNNTTVLEYSDTAKKASELAESMSYEKETEFINDLLQSTNLSNREIEVVTLKHKGLTHGAIALALSAVDDHLILAVMNDEPSALTKNTVDEYSRRAKNKYEQSKVLIKHLSEVYSQDPLEKLFGSN